MDVSFTLHIKEHPQWHINSLLLAEEHFCDKISQSIDFFIDTNRSDDISRSLLWESLKAFLRGEIISFASYNKTRQEKLRTVSESITTIDRQFASNPTPELYKRRLDLQSEVNLLTTRNAENLILQSQGSFFL
ncbi:hypothetical protein LDENG_00192420 [Lucifuga dentata]|nr:hypothetical protein LDENG_00192420 [Lucifuga dentata]